MSCRDGRSWCSGARSWQLVHGGVVHSDTAHLSLVGSTWTESNCIIVIRMIAILHSVWSRNFDAMEWRMLLYLLYSGSSITMEKPTSHDLQASRGVRSARTQSCTQGPELMPARPWHTSRPSIMHDLINRLLWSNSPGNDGRHDYPSVFWW